jgi:hypothetical protein
MNINPLVESALSGLMYCGKPVPVDFITHEGKAAAHITYYTYGEGDEYYADDEPEGGNIYGTVDVFCKMSGDYEELIETVKARLRAAGFRASKGPEQYEKDADLYHASIDFNIENTEV